MAKNPLIPKKFAAEIKAEEDKRRKAFEEQLAADRSKKITILHIREVRADLVEGLKESQKQIAALDRELAKLTGEKVAVAASEKSPGSRFRPTAEEIASTAEGLGKLFKGGSEVSRLQILEAVGSKYKTHIPKLIAAWNKAHADEKIGTNGQKKSKSRYVMR